MSAPQSGSRSCSRTASKTSAHQAEPHAHVQDLDEAAGLPEDELVRAGQRVARELRHAALGVEPADERLGVRAQALDVVRGEADVRVDPHQLVEALGEGLARELAAPQVDRDVARPAAHLVAPAFELGEAALALGLGVGAHGDEHDAASFRRAQRHPSAGADVTEHSTDAEHVPTALDDPQYSFAPARSRAFPGV